MELPINKNDDIIIEITSMGSEGQGVGRHEGFAVFVPLALVGETVEAHIIKVTSSYAIGKLTAVIVASPDRVESNCSAFGRCGGCALRHMSYPAQLEYKREQVKNAMERLGGFKGIEVLPTIGMENPFRYRNKGSFPFADVGSGAQWGLYAKRSHRLIPVEDCDIERLETIAAANAVREWATENSVPIYNEMSGLGVLRHVVTRVTESGVAVTVVTTGALPEKEQLISCIRSLVPSVRSIVHNINPRNTNVITGDENHVIWGEASLRQTVCGMTFEVSAESFLQVNPEQTEVLYTCAADGLNLSKEDSAADIYCGIGTITLMLAKRTGHVIGIENVSKAVEDAKRNAAQNGIDNAEFICGEAEIVLPSIVRTDKKLTAITLDPPRKGAEPDVLHAIVNSGASRIAYVSCNPATLARDCRILVDGGYDIVSVQPVDMFPMTHHVETVVLMRKQ